jgi:hypothetical protein
MRGIHKEKVSLACLCLFYSRFKDFFLNSSCASGSAPAGTDPTLRYRMPSFFRNTPTWVLLRRMPVSFSISAAACTILATGFSRKGEKVDPESALGGHFLE